MTLYEKWQTYADSSRVSQEEFNTFWNAYFQREMTMYQKLLSTSEVMNGTLSEMANTFGVDIMTMVGFLEGINTSLKEKNPLETMDETTQVTLDYDKALLYRNMVAAKADWLYNLKEWDAHLTEEERKELYRAQKKSTTIIKGKKIGRNEPCPCGSGKKYKQCCGR